MTRKFDYGKAYRRAHEANPTWFRGAMDLDLVDMITELVEQVGAKRLLDYGSGKGRQYMVEKVHERWGGILPTCYDVGVHFLSFRPVGPFDGVICTDVMEHVDESDIGEVLSDIFGFVRPGGFVFFNIFCNLARKQFPDGKNVHLTVQHPDWWRRRLRKAYPRRSNIILRDQYVYFGGDDLQP